MRWIAWLAVPVVLAVLVTDAGGARSGAADRCRPPRSETVAQTSRVRVYRDLRRRYPTTYVCLFSRGRPLALDQPTDSLARRPVAINGRFVAYVRSSAEEDAAGPSRCVAWSHVHDGKAPGAGPRQARDEPLDRARFAAGSRVELGTWRVAWADVDGIFRRSMLGTRKASSIPVRRATSGEVGFARFDTNTDYNRFRARSRLVVIPFGDRVQRSRRAPRLGLGTFARATARRLLVPVYCDRSCVVAHVGRLEPFTVGYVRVAISGRKRIHVRVRAVDDARHRSRARATFVRSRRLSLWCRAPRDC